MKRYMVDKSALEHNINLLLEMAKGKTLWGVIKGDGYGLGVVEMARVLAAHGIEHFAVTDLCEVRALRSDGFDNPILMMEGTCNEQEVNELLDLRAILTIGTLEDAQVVNAQAQARSTVAEAHLKIDTGMGRYGFLPSQMETVHSLYANHPNIAFTGIYTHFYNSSELAPTQVQFDKFMAVVGELQAAGIDTGMVHCCNSSAFLKYEHMHCDGARVGSALPGDHWRPHRFEGGGRLSGRAGGDPRHPRGSQRGLWRGLGGQAGDPDCRAVHRLLQRLWRGPGLRFVAAAGLSAGRCPVCEGLPEKEGPVCDGERKALPGAGSCGHGEHGHRRHRL